MSVKRKISVSIGATLQLAPYETYRVDINYETQVDDNLKIKAAYKEAKEIVFDELKETLKEAKQNLLEKKRKDWEEE